MNTFQVVGRLGGDPETTTFASGDTKVAFNLVDNRKVKGVEESSWFKVIAFGKTAEIIASHLHKGSQVFVAGRMQQRKYTTSQGEEKKVYEVVASQVEFIGPRVSNNDGDELPE